MATTGIRPMMPHALSSSSSSSSSVAAAVSMNEDDMTVERFLEMQCESIIRDFQTKTSIMIKQLQTQYDEGAAAIIQLAKAQNSTTQTKKVSVILKVIAGAHIGQRFRLEAQSATSEDIFKVGRASGKAIKEKGVSLYKDKEISTSHAKIEILRGLPFLVDTRSTNGTQLNNEELEKLVPYRLQTGDIITMGSTELRVQVLDNGDEDIMSP